MSRSRLILAAFACWMQLASTHAQTIVVPPQTSVGAPIIAKLDGLPEGARIAWRASPGASVINVGLGKAHVWAPPGVHTLSAVVAPKEGDELLWLDSQFVVGDRPTPTVPVVKTLAQLAGVDAAAISARLEAIAAVADDLKIETFPAVLTGSLGPWKANPATAVIVKRLSLKDMAAVVAELGRIIDELRKATPIDPPLPPAPDSPKATAVVYVFEKDQTVVPNAVRVALDRLNRDSSRKIRATVFEDDMVNGDDDVPDQYKAPLEAARKLGLPALVVMAGDKVLVAKQNPLTVEAVMEAIP